MDYFRVDMPGMDRFVGDLSRCGEEMRNAASRLKEIGSRGLGTKALDEACEYFQDTWHHGIGKVSELAGKMLEGLQETLKVYREAEESIRKLFPEMAGTAGAGAAAGAAIGGALGGPIGAALGGAAGAAAGGGTGIGAALGGLAGDVGDAVKSGVGKAGDALRSGIEYAKEHPEIFQQGGVEAPAVMSPERAAELAGELREGAHQVGERVAEIAEKIQEHAPDKPFIGIMPEQSPPDVLW